MERSEQSCSRKDALANAFIRYEDAQEAAKAAHIRLVAARNDLARIVGVPPLHGDSRIVELAKMKLGMSVIAERRCSK